MLSEYLNKQLLHPRRANWQLFLSLTYRKQWTTELVTYSFYIRIVLISDLHLTMLLLSPRPPESTSSFFFIQTIQSSLLSLMYNNTVQTASYVNHCNALVVIRKMTNDYMARFGARNGFNSFSHSKFPYLLIACTFWDLQSQSGRQGQRI